MLSNFTLYQYHHSSITKTMKKKKEIIEINNYKNSKNCIDYNDGYYSTRS